VSNHLETFLQERLPKPEEMLGNKQLASAPLSDRNYLKPSSELHQLLEQGEGELKGMLLLSVII